jgi:hypothetical protein
MFMQDSRPRSTHYIQQTVLNDVKARVEEQINQIAHIGNIQFAAETMQIIFI